ncbi:enoyl-CoA hydratase [Amycolatopsis sp. WAC 04197]|uniref:MaoC family dehydratase n=1 Tax=Amycolatopsis sp. WAC 04197 TaxID=2203199 RepID=UPI000F7787C0|nr:MaoC family dehydratase [Amycolatopsis sp. WAC 04197]RSN46130.1 enoyl-CoA hydratase [Amycolatopsis sp. WAC 04197]
MITANGLEEIRALAGRDLGTSAWRTVTQDLIDTFAEVSGDHQWIHTDPVRAAAGPFGKTIAHGYLTLSWGIPMFAELLHVTGMGMALNYGLNKVRFPAPVPVGSRVRLHASVQEVTPVLGDGVQMVRAFTFELEGSPKPACAAESVTRYYL